MGKLPIWILMMILVSAMNHEFGQAAEHDDRFSTYILSIIGKAVCFFALALVSMMIIGAAVEV